MSFKDKDKRKEYKKIWIKKNREKYNAMHRISYKTRIKKEKIRDDECNLCGSPKNLIFHHTNYEKDLGFTVCPRCHSQIHKKKVNHQETMIRKKPKLLKRIEEERTKNQFLKDNDLEVRE